MKLFLANSDTIMTGAFNGGITLAIGEVSEGKLCSHSIAIMTIAEVKDLRDELSRKIRDAEASMTKVERR